MTRDELQAAVLARTGTSDVTIAITAINNAYQEIVGRAHQNLVEVVLPLVAGTSKYSINALLLTAVGFQDFYGLYELYGTDTTLNNSPLEQNDLSHIVKMRASSTTSGQPTNFAMVGPDGLEFWPTPTSGQQVTLWYDRWRTANNLTTGPQIPSLIMEPYHDLLDLRASLLVASRYESMGENRGLKGDVAAEYDRRMAEFLAFTKNRQGKQTRRIYTGFRRFARLRPAVPSQDLGGRS